uniref:EKC/KEOPS complex subunit TP53RK-like n=1 Tax=Styela clava TaxID=7725 RepID=UPI00193AC62D|nr:EKC/KEOPS complex subunit TP53RK-like [Styela clava]
MNPYVNHGVLLHQGAEAKIYKCEFLGRTAIIKFRFSKKYRHPELDEKLTKKRITQEARSLLRCRNIGVQTPAVYFVDLDMGVLVLEYFDMAQTLKEHIFQAYEKYDTPGQYPPELVQIIENVGQKLAMIHNSDIIHGDLTSSNILVECQESSERKNSVKIIFIDFGLSSSSRLVEDKGVDLYVLEKAFLSTHPNSENLFGALIKSYKTHSTNCKGIISKYEEVKLRGRKRTMVG